MQHTKPLWEVLGGCRLFVASGDWSYSVWRDVTCSSTPRDQHAHTHTHTLALSLCFSPGWSELFISLSTSAASREMLSLGHYKYPQAVENVLTDTGDKRGPPCCCLSAAVWWCSEWPTFLSLRYFILDLMKSWITNLKPYRDRMILSHTDWNTQNYCSKVHLTFILRHYGFLQKSYLFFTRSIFTFFAMLLWGENDQNYYFVHYV